MSRSGFTSSTVRITSSNCVTSPRTTGAPVGTPPKVAAPGLRSMPTTFSPRATRRRMTRGPMKPVAPITSTDMRASCLVLAGRLPGDHAPVRAGLRVHRQIAHGEPILLPVALHVHVRHAVDDADTADDTHAPVAGSDPAVVRLATAEIGDVLGLRLLPGGRVHVGQVVGQGGVERGPVPLLHRLEAAVVGAKNVGLEPGGLRRRGRYDSLLRPPRPRAHVWRPCGTPGSRVCRTSRWIASLARAESSRSA